MSTQKLLGLPSISPELKPILPFLQRAEELQKQQPVIAYWCAYYAAQLGIGLKARGSASRDVLFRLLEVLEGMKKEIGNVDAIEIEAASAAFVENFALRVFQSADNEDRSGVATRATARKFLAASNFLEVLRTFPKADVSESTEDKIRYAKWKAADISKALREGRKPTPGPAAEEQNQPLLVERSSPPPSQTTSTHQQYFDVSPAQIVSHDTSSESPPRSIQTHRRGGSGGSTQSGTGAQPFRSKKAWVSDDVEGQISPSSSPRSSMKVTRRDRSPEGKEQVHFNHTSDIIPSAPEYPPKVPSPAEVYQGPSSIYAAPSEKRSPSPPSLRANIIPPPNSPPRMNIYASPSHPEIDHSSPPPRAFLQRLSPQALVPDTLTRVELTPQLINQAQKHCRFAISSLDYEDAEQAKKELRAALALLGGI